MRPFVIFAALLLLVSVYLFSKKQTVEAVSYNRDIRPVVNAQCIGCHGGVKASAKLSLLTREEALATTESGLPAILPGDAKNSELIKRLRHHDPEQRMPQEGEPLDEKTIRLFEAWVDQGAQWEEHWAFIPPKRPALPATDPLWARNEIDHFVHVRLEAEGMKAAPEARKSVLVRRLYLDLIGLPPTPEQAEAFLQDTSSQAYENLVDQLLASPHFGERWAAMWLDLARYADSKGYEKDLNRSIWKYRDWVIQSLNENKAFDQFTIEQLAGDLLPQASEKNLIATAFHRNTMTNDEGGTRNEEFRAAAMVERVSTTYEVWQGITMSCVQCHTHPYDPIRHEEFYETMAFFNNTVDADMYNDRPNLFTYEGEQAVQAEKLLEWLESQLPDSNAPQKQKPLYQREQNLMRDLGYRQVEAERMHNNHQVIELIPQGQDVVWQIQDSTWIMFENVNLQQVSAISFRVATPLSGMIEVWRDSLDGKKLGSVTIEPTGQWERPMMVKPIAEKWRTLTTSIPEDNDTHDLYYLFRKHRHTGQHLFHLDWIFYHEEAAPWKQYGSAYEDSLKALYAIRPVPTPIMQELPTKRRRENRIFERGNWLVPGAPVQPDVPSILASNHRQDFTNRLDLAQWLINTDNQLTARVTVNRFWGQLFGYGLVETMEDFGSQGFPPSHPQLLDWLAVTFSEDYQWDIKKLLKLMVMSATYRQASEASPKQFARDPKNRLLARGPKVRLTAEQIRDQALAAGGLLNTKMYGPSVYPDRPDTNGSFWGGWGKSNPDEQNRRSIYIFWRRTNPYPSMITFDTPSRTVCSSRRIRTNTPLQALTMLNDPVYYRAAEALAELMRQEHPENLREQIRYAYYRATLQYPSEEKLHLLETMYQQALEHYTDIGATAHSGADAEVSMLPDQEARALVANTILNLDEFINKN